jgi:hypothetical protein
MKTLLIIFIALLGTPFLFADLTPSDEQALRFMREEEKVARDVYQALYAIFGQNQFANVARSEQRHMDSVLTLMDQYGLEDSASPVAGVFNDPDLQSLYDDLVALGSESLAKAYWVGVLIEETDIADLIAAMEATENPDLDRLFNSLCNGSYNHLAAFSGGLATLAGFSSADYVDGWFLSWMDWMRLEHFPWIQTVDGQWYYLSPTAGGGLFFTTNGGLWYWTSSSAYPWVFDLAADGWVNGLPAA